MRLFGKEYTASIRAYRIILIFICFVITSQGEVPVYAAACKPEQKVDAVSYRMNLKLDTKNDSLDETVTIKFKNNTRKPVSQIYLRDMTPASLNYFKENYADKSNSKVTTTIKSVRLKGSKKNLKFQYKKFKTVLVVNLGKNINPGRTGEVVVRMKTDIPERQDRFGVQKTKYGKLFALSFCFPYLADNYNGKWNTDPYFDDGESRSSDIANYYVKFTAPKSYVVAATGKETTKNGVTTVTARRYRDFAIVASDFMKKDTFRVKGIRINNYYLKGNHPDQYRKLSKMVAADCINLFSERVGRYNYDELDMVQCLFGFGFGGMEYPGLVMLNGSAYFEGQGHKLGAQSLAEVVSHEIGHQWFYGAVGNREYAEAWLDEGFTSFLEKDMYGLTDNKSNKYLRVVDKYVASIKDMKREQEELLEAYKKEGKGMYLNISPPNYPEDREYAYAEYEGGYLFLVDVRKQMGNRKFNNFLKDYYKKYNMKTVTTKDVVRLLRKYDNSDKMNKLIKFYIKL